MILMIHNPKRSDRLELLLAETRLQGINGDTVLMPAVTDTLNPVRNISRAHKNCIKVAQRLKMDRIIVLEDDVKFVCRNSFSRFLELADELPPDWDIFLSGVYDGVLQDHSENIRKVTKFSGLHCYMVHERYYDTFLSANEDVNLDKWMSTPGWGSSNAYLAYPMLAMQHDGFSDNVRKVTDYNTQVNGRFRLWDCPENESSQTKENDPEIREV
jgi:hypothetical protein